MQTLAVSLRILLVLLVVTLAGGVAARKMPSPNAPGGRDADESQLAAIAEYFDLDSIPDWNHYKVAQVMGRSYPGSESEPASLKGQVVFEPHLIQGDLCLLEVALATAKDSGGTYDWSPMKWIYFYWLSSSNTGCLIDTSDLPPPNSIESQSSVPSALVRDSLRNSDALLSESISRYLESSRVAVAAGQLKPDQVADTTEWVNYKLAMISFLGVVDPEVGFALEANFERDGRFTGIRVMYSIGLEGINVHSVSWLR